MKFCIAIALVAILAGAAPPSANAAIPPLEYLGRWRDVSYEAAPAKLCKKLLQIKPARSDNPTGCRFKKVRIIRYYRVADDYMGLAANMEFRDFQITWGGPFGFWSATSRAFAQFDGTTITMINHKCPTEAAVVKINLEPDGVKGCDTWHANKELVHEVVFRIWCDPCLPGLALSKVFWAQQWVRPNGVVGADMFFP